ncbi:Glutamyl-tRNA(Gln) amidotransferase [Fragilaria crotonensis]|nr:Glutamyl-tRNA(Gln) amidotransferase [Fragilaria crotonensis]
MSIPTLVYQLRAGTLRIGEYVDTLEERFLNMEPVVYAFVPEPRRWERIRKEAAELEIKYPDPAQRPILYGLPVGIKDIFRVDGLPTRAGSQLPAHVLDGPESTCVTQLREAGCLIFGKTATTEFAYSSPGPTRNPCNPFHTPDVVGAELIFKVLANSFALSDPVQASNVTLGIPIGPYLELAEPEMLSHFHETSNLLQAAGFTVKRIKAMPNFDEIRKRHVTLNLREFADYHSQFSTYHHLYAPATLELVKMGRTVSNEELERAKRCKLETRNHLTALMDEHGLDAWITPGATGPAPLGFESTGNPIMQLPWSCSGLPTLNMKSGTHDNGLPLSLQLAARWNHDEILLNIGKIVEAALR